MTNQPPKAADPRRDHLVACERETASRRDREAAQAMHRAADAPAPVLVLVRHDQTAPGSTGAARIAGYRATPQTGHPPIPAGALWDLETELGYPADDPEGPTWLAYDQAPWAVVTTLMRRGSYTEGQALAEVLRWCARQTTPFDDVLWEIRRG